MIPVDFMWKKSSLSRFQQNKILLWVSEHEREALCSCSALLCAPLSQRLCHLQWQPLHRHISVTGWVSGRIWWKDAPWYMKMLGAWNNISTQHQDKSQQSHDGAPDIQRRASTECFGVVAGVSTLAWNEWVDAALSASFCVKLSHTLDYFCLFFGLSDSATISSVVGTIVTLWCPCFARLTEAKAPIRILLSVNASGVDGSKQLEPVLNWNWFSTPIAAIHPKIYSSCRYIFQSSSDSFIKTKNSEYSSVQFWQILLICLPQQYGNPIIHRWGI